MSEKHAQDKPRRVNMQARPLAQHAQALYLEPARPIPHIAPGHL